MSMSRLRANNSIQGSLRAGRAALMRDLSGLNTAMTAKAPTVHSFNHHPNNTKNRGRTMAGCSTQCNNLCAGIVACFSYS